MSSFKVYILIFTVGIFLYFPSLFGKFVWDDEDFVYANQYVANFQIDKFFSASITEGRGKLSNYFRPVQEIVYATTHSLFGFNPFWYHLLNILVHISAACAIFYFFSILLDKAGGSETDSLTDKPGPKGPFRFDRLRVVELSGPAFVISVLFLIHPVQTEAVSYISGLSDPPFVLFGFLSLIFLLANRSLLSAICFSLSLLSKETALVFLPLIFLTSFLTNRFSGPLSYIRSLWKKLLPFALISILYLWYHFSFINSFNIKAAWGSTPYANSLIVRLLTFIQNLFLYVSLLLFPKDLFMERDYSISIQTHLLNFPLIFLTTLTSLTVFFLWKLRPIHPHWKVLVFCFLGFFISFIPYSGIVLINGIFYEHFLYLPLVFFFGFWLVLFEKHISHPRISLILLIPLILLILRNLSRQLDWIDPVRFYSQTLVHAPKSIRIINGLGIAYAENGQFDQAIKTYSLIPPINPNIPNTYHNMANAFAAKGDFKNAEKFYLKAIEVDPKFYYSYQSLANLYQQTNQTEKLQQLLKRFNQ